MLHEENIANIQKPNGIQIERLCQLKIQIYVYICKKKRSNSYISRQQQSGDRATTTTTTTRAIQKRHRHQQQKQQNRRRRRRRQMATAADLQSHSQLKLLNESKMNETKRAQNMNDSRMYTLESCSSYQHVVHNTSRKYIHM